MIRYSIGILVASSLTCSTVANAREKEPQTFTQISTYYGAQVAVGECVQIPARTSEKRSALLGAILTSAIGKGVNLLGQAFTKAGAEKTWSATASRNFEPKEGANGWFPHCIQFARGSFSSGNQGPGIWKLQGWADDVAQKLAANGMVLAARPDFLFEAEIVQSENVETVLTLRPVLASFGDPIGTRAMRGDSREIALFFAFSPAGTKPTLATNPAATIILGPMGSYTTRTFPDMNTSTPRIRTPYEAGWFTLGKDSLSMPLTATVMVSETQGADKFLSFIGSVLGDKPVQDALNNALTMVVVPGVAEEAATKQDNAATDAKSSAQLKLAIAIGKVSACAAGSKPVDEGSAAVAALSDYLKADRALNRPSGLVTQSMIDTIQVSKPATVKNACQVMLAKITPD